MAEALDATRRSEQNQENPESLITPEMRAMIGVEGDVRRYEVEKGPIRMYARAVGYTDRIFWDEDYARSQGYRGLVAPPGFFGFRIPDGPEDFHGAGGGNVRENERGQMMSGLNAGQRYVLTPGVVICAGDVLTSVGKLINIRQTRTSLGPTLITETERIWRNQNGEIVCKQYGSLLSRPVPSKKDEAP